MSTGTESQATQQQGKEGSATLINPHNPDFLTKRPWYLGGGDQDAGAAPTLEHQQKLDDSAPTLTLTEAEEALRKKREREQKLASSQTFVKGQWVEALKKNKLPYRICKILKVYNKSATSIGSSFYDLEFEDGTTEYKVKIPNNSRQNQHPRIRATKTGSRSEGVIDGKAESYDSKRDKYHGYNRESHNATVASKYEQRDTIRRKIREEEKKLSDILKKNTGGDKEEHLSDSDLDSDNESSDDEFAQRDSDAKVITSRLARQGGVGGAQMKVTARNLRIREDTAKYLRNLQPDSAYYDPKSRSMRENPNPEKSGDASEFAGDNFYRISGDAVGLAEQQVFCWDASGKGVSVHPQANPSQAELLKKEFKDKASTLKTQQQQALLSKYGGQEYLDGNSGLAAAATKSNSKSSQNDAKAGPDARTRFGITTTVDEYAPSGRLLKKAGARVKHEPIESKYEEDIFTNGHNTVWGSYFHKGAFIWGYADDHSLFRNSYCTGDNGRIANDEANEMKYGTGKAGSAALAQARGMLKALPKQQAAALSSSTPLNRSKHYGEADPKAEVDPSKLEDALQRAATAQKGDFNSNKRKYNSMHADVDVTEEDMEAFRLLRSRGSDPMAQVGSDKLLEYEEEK